MGGDEEHLEESRALYLAGAAQSIPDTITDRFTGTIAVAAGATVAESGLINGSRQIALALPQVVFGDLADSFGKRRIIIAGRVLSGLAFAALAFVGAPLWLLVLIVVISATTAMATPAWGSLIGDYAGEVGRGEVIGRISAVAQIGGFAAMVTALIIAFNQTGPMNTGIIHRPPPPRVSLQLRLRHSESRSRRRSPPWGEGADSSSPPS